MKSKIARRVLGVDRKSMNWGINQIVKMIKKGTMEFDHIVQRSYVWELTRKTALIESILLGYPVPHVWARQYTTFDDKKIYSILDGKQRLMTLHDFLSNKFALSEIDPICYEGENDEMIAVDISGKTFDELPPELQEIIKTTSISVNYFDSLEEAEEQELFKRLNNGKPLSSKSKLLASCKNLHDMVDIGQHDLFSQCMTQTGRENKNYIATIMKIWCMLNMEIDEISFESKAFTPIVEDTAISDSEKVILNNLFTKIINVHDLLPKEVAKKFYREIHMVGFAKYINTDQSEELLAQWVEDFFTNTPQRYTEVCSNGINRNASIKERDSIIATSYEEYFKIDGEDIEEHTVTNAEE